MKELKKLHLVSHTHWDREWYLPFETFRIRLIKLLDKLLVQMEVDPLYRFHLDGQAIILEDYMELRPENKDRIKRLVQSGQLTIGPWYVLFDAFLISPESFIRNYEEGVRICAEFGEMASLGYMPDTFSHISQMPLILKQLGLDHAVIWRGLDGLPEQTPSEFFWEASSGDRVKTVHLSHLHGYTSAMALPHNPEEAAERLQKLIDTIAPYSLTGHVLLMNGIDHLEPQQHIREIIGHWNATRDIQLEQSSFKQLMEAIDASDVVLPVLQGEFRHTNFMQGSGLNQITPGVLSSRVYLKQQNARVQTWMEKLAEPLEAVMRSLSFGDHPEFVRLAWKYIIQNHPHDSICGCSIDAVHNEMETRSMKAEQIARQLVVEALGQLAERTDVSWVADNAKPVLFVNPLPWQRSELVEFEFDADENMTYRSVCLYDRDGNETLGEIAAVEKICPVQPYSGVYPLSREETNRYRIRAHLTGLPALGYKVMAVRLRQAPPLSMIPLQAARRYIENELVRISIDADGTLIWLDRETGDEWRGLHDFEDGGDAGDGYLYSPPICDFKCYSAPGSAGISVTSQGYGWSEMKVSVTLHIPKALHPEGKERSKETVPLHIVTRIRLAPGKRTATFRTETVNGACDHRLRVIFPIYEKKGPVYAGGHFDVLGRNENVEQPTEAAWLESEPTTFPFQQFLYADTAKAHMILTGEGLHEYEWIADKSPLHMASMKQAAADNDGLSNNGRLALTLFRSVSHLFAADRGMNIRIWAGGVFIATPGANCLGNLSFDYSLTIEPLAASGAAGFTAAVPWRIADECSVSVVAAQLPLIGKFPDGQNRDIDSTGTFSLPEVRSFIEIKTPGIHVSCIRPLKSGKGFEIRLVNLNAVEIRAMLAIDLPVASIEVGLANGTRTGMLTSMANLDGHTAIDVDVPAKNISTLFVNLAE